MVGEKIMPTGVKVISVLYYIGAAFSFLFGLLFIVGGAFIGAILGEKLAVLGTIGSSIFIILGIALLGFGVLDIFIGRGLWKGQNWARVTAIVLAIFSILNGLNVLIWRIVLPLAYSKPIEALIIFFAFTQLAVGLLIGGYLAFAHEVKEAFAQ